MHIDALISNLHFVDEIVFVDSFSTDGTVEKIQSQTGVAFYQKKFESFPSQKNFALSKATHDWILFIDADERVSDKGVEEILHLVKNTSHNAFWARFQYYFGEKKIRFSGLQSARSVRLFRKSKCSYDTGKLVHEALIIEGSSGELKYKFKHYNFRDFEHYKSKIRIYAQLKAKNHFNQGKKPSFLLACLKCVYRFINHYILRLGILDGKVGFVISYLNAYGIIYRYKVLKELYN